MHIHTLDRSQTFPEKPDRIFTFFAEAGNLETITPPWLHFRILTPQPIVMEPGRLIDYRLKLRGIPLRWQSEITVWEPRHRFVDEQRRGPYRSWVHEHLFAEENGCTVVRDRVRYAVTGGRLVHRLFVARQLERIFDYRRRKLTEIFPTVGESRQSCPDPELFI